MSLSPVSFKTGRQSSPRLSAPYVPGKHAARFWTEAEREILRAHYPTGGAAACLAHLGAHRTKSGVYVEAGKLGLEAPKGGGKKQRIGVPAGFDELLTSAWQGMAGDKRGEVAAFAESQGLPRWWVSQRARKLGLVLPHKKEPPWTRAEDELLKRAPIHDLDAAAEFFRAHGFRRSPTAIGVRCKRQELSRRAARPTLSAHRVAKILGVDDKTVTREILMGDLKAAKREDRRLPQQGGSAWDVTRADLRAYIIAHLDRIDFRKVDKFALVDVLVGPAGGAE